MATSIREGMQVLTAFNLAADPNGWIMEVAYRYVTGRLRDAEGVVTGPFPGLWDVWAVRHADGSEAAYSGKELRPGVRRAPLPEKAVNMTKVLCDAAMKGDTAQVQSLLTDGADVNGRDEKQMTALIWAAKNGYTDTVRVLLDAHADIEARSAQGVTPLCGAAWDGHLATTKLLLERGAVIDPPTPGMNSVSLVTLARGDAVKDLLVTWQCHRATKVAVMKPLQLKK